MGERVSCEMRVFGETDTKTWAKVTEVINEQLAPIDEPADGHFLFEEVNYGILPAEVKAVLQRAGLSYLWLHEGHHDFGQGYEAYDAEEMASAEGERFGFDLAILVRDVDNEPYVQSIKGWQGFVHESLNKTLVLQ